MGKRGVAMIRAYESCNDRGEFPAKPRARTLMGANRKAMQAALWNPLYVSETVRCSLHWRKSCFVTIGIFIIHILSTLLHRVFCAGGVK
jgi:hypothetical protein